MRFDISEYSTKLKQRPDGIWVNGSPQAEMSYPHHGNEVYSYIEENSFWFDHRNKVITSLTELFPPEGPIFDIGGGNGYVALALQQAGYPTIVVEPGEYGARTAKQRGIHTVVQSTLEGAGFSEGLFHACGLFDVLEHIEEDGAFLKSLHRFLQPGGHLYLAVPAYNALWSNEDDFAGHFRRYTLKMLHRLMKHCGFSVQYSSYIFGCLVPVVFALRSVPSYLGLRSKEQNSLVEKEHAKPTGISGRVLNSMLQAELNQIRQGKSVPFGTSCVLVATKQ